MTPSVPADNLNVTKFLLDHSIADLKELGINHRWSTKNPRKVSLNYDQILAPEGNPIVNECRGLVLRWAGDPESRGGPGLYTVLARPMPRMYNWGSGHAHPVFKSEASRTVNGPIRYFDKVDGTLCIVYFDTDLNEVCVATRSVPDADLPGSSGKTFAEMFWEAIKEGDECEWLLNWYDPSPWTVCCELTGPDNRIVIPYDKPKVYELATTHNLTGETASYALTSGPKELEFASWDEMTSWVNTQPGHLCEGIVAVSGAGHRVKIKNRNYIEFSRTTALTTTSDGLMGMILRGVMDDTLPFLPQQLQREVESLQNSYGILVHALQVQVGSAPPDRGTPESRKEAALHFQANYPSKKFIGVCMKAWESSEVVSDLMTRQKKNGEFSKEFLATIVNTARDLTPGAD